MLGGMIRKVFGGAQADRAALDRVKALAREALALGDEVRLSVNEINCNDPACPGTETVILVMAEGERTRALKVTKPADEVVAQDIREADAASRA
jgi:hypothetical protein